MYLEMNYLDASGPQKTIACPGCGQVTPQYPHQITSDRKTLCFDCYEDTEECSECAGLFCPDDLENGLCGECGITCDDCSKRVPEREITVIDSCPICDDCRDDYSRCPGCENWHSGDYDYCDPCAEARGECYGCGREDWIDNLYFYELDNERYCSRCLPSDEVILPYNEDPLDHLTFAPNPSGVYLGIELEVECPGEDRKELAEKILDQMGRDSIVCKEDGSLTNGFEVVSRPACLQGQKKIWEKLFDSVPKGLVSFDSKNCGLHIHVDRSLLTSDQIERIVEFVNKEENEKFVTTIAQRRSDSYACLKPGKKECYSTDRYEAVNLTNPNTIELRIFKGTLKAESFFKSLEFADALVVFCGDWTETEMTYQAFCAWFNKDYYSNLANFLADHNYIKEAICV